MGLVKEINGLQPVETVFAEVKSKIGANYL